MAMNNYRYIYSLNAVPEEKLGAIGGKAGSLSRMMGLKKLRVPEGYVLPADGLADGKLRAEAEA